MLACAMTPACRRRICGSGGGGCSETYARGRSRRGRSGVLALDRNGRPRFHLLVRWSPGGGGYTWLDVRDEVVSSWAQVIAAGRKGPKDGTPPAAVARIELRITEDRLARYLTNAGGPGPSAGQGRWWGILGRDAYAATVAGDRRAGLAKEANHAGGHRSESSSTAPSRR